MSLQAMVWAWERNDVTPTEKFVLLALADHANYDGICWPGAKGVAEKTGFSRVTISATIRKLAAKALLWIERRQNQYGGDLSNLYHLAVKQPQPGVQQFDGGGQAIKPGAPSNLAGGGKAIEGGEATNLAGGCQPALPESSRSESSIEPKEESKERSTPPYPPQGGSEPDLAFQLRRSIELEQSKRRAQPARATTLPPTWELTDELRNYARRFAVDPEFVAEEMRNWAAAKGEQRKDWNAVYRTFVLHARNRPSGSHRSEPLTGVELCKQMLAEELELKARRGAANGPR